MARARGLRGPEPVGPPPLRVGPAGARLRQPDCLFIYFRCVPRVVMATAPSFPASLGHRCFQTFPGQGLLRGCSICLRGHPGYGVLTQGFSVQMSPPFWRKSSTSFSSHLPPTDSPSLGNANICPPHFLDSGFSAPASPTWKSFLGRLSFLTSNCFSLPGTESFFPSSQTVFFWYSSVVWPS